jgi:sortase A
VSAIRRAVGVLGELLITAGLVVGLFLAWQLWWTDVAAGNAQSTAVARLAESFEDPTVGPPAGSATESASRPALGEATAIIRIPRFGKDWAKPVYEGTGREVLDRGVGHYVTTAQPGEVGNYALAGHRVTYGRPFNRIAELRPGDQIDVQTAAGHFVYLVQDSQVVTPDRTEVIAPVPGRPGEKPSQAWLTLTSCHPQYSAAERYVVHALLQERP